MYAPESGGSSLVATPPKTSHTGCNCVRWHAAVCYDAPEWYHINIISWIDKRLQTLKVPAKV